jgi:hypothetical protein
MQKVTAPKLDAAMSAAEAYACSLKSIQPRRVAGQYGALLRRAALVEAHQALQAIEDPEKHRIDAGRMSAAARLMLAHVRLMNSSQRMKISQSRLDLAYAAHARGGRAKRHSHEEQPHEGPHPAVRRRSRHAEYPILSDAEIDAILAAKDMRGQDAQR